MDNLPKYVAAAVQAAPVYLDREATIDKACQLIEEAGNAGARLIVFPETWVPMYPFWTSTPGVFSGKLFVKLWKNAVEVPSNETSRLAQAAKRANAYVAIGINERDTVGRGTIFNTLLYLSPTGEVMHRHRKLMPTFTERTVWGFGDGSDLDVMDTELGRLSGLICWEHEMTLAKYALYAQGEQVHCGVWPAYTFQNDHIDFGSRQYAFEGACFVVAACGVVGADGYPDELGAAPNANGGTSIIGPDGKYIAGPIFDSEEILYGEIDIERAIHEKHSRDIAGHYARPDVFQLVMNTRRKPIMSFMDTAAAAAVLTGEVHSAHAAADRLQAMREYLGSLMERAGADGDTDVNEALVEALASIDMAASGMWSSP
ncbi:MAG TPA: carbon-nitrogen hydrolase family protein [Rhodanobacteraceae bacterium]|nr:carbon-nitrogen hydrolase family protein [Rhodanobacteraceae bacterium]